MRIRTELQPGDAGEIVRMHGALYSAEYGLDRTMEAHVARGLADMLERGWPSDGEGVWIADHGDGRIGGALALTREGPTLGRVRWFILDPELRGQGLGRRLLNELLEAARRAGYERLELTTFGELEAAGRLYRDAGFRCVESERTELWGRKIELQSYELELGGT